MVVSEGADSKPGAAFFFTCPNMPEPISPLLSNRLARLDAVIEPIAHAHGAEVVDFECKREPGGWVLRVYVEKLGSAAGNLDRAGGGSTSASAPTSRGISARRSTWRTSFHIATTSRSAPPASSARSEASATTCASQERRPRSSCITRRLPDRRFCRRARSRAPAKRPRNRERWGARPRHRLSTTSPPPTSSSSSAPRPSPARRSSGSAHLLRVILETASPTEAKHPSEETLMAIQQQANPPASDVSLLQAIEMVAKDKGDRQDAPRQDDRRGDPQGRAERLRPERASSRPASTRTPARSISSST